MQVALINIYENDSELERYYTLTYKLLEERKPAESISHKEMPLFEDHKKFVNSHPYWRWFAIENGDYTIGFLYVTLQDEIGIGIFDGWKRQGYATKAINELFNMYPKNKFYANINPRNAKSINLFRKLGFNHIQNTYQRLAQ